MVAMPASASSGMVAMPASASSGYIELEEPLTGPQRIKRALTFWSRVLPILGAYKVADLALDAGAASSLVAVGLVSTEAVARAGGVREAVKQALHEWGSVQLEETIQELKGFYVKTGQVIY